MFSNLQNLTPWTPERVNELGEAREHIQFVVKLYAKQIEAGRVFLHEHPANATSWDLEEIAELTK
eukprot:11217079-Karenia_brevis.AAC.1